MIYSIVHMQKYKTEGRAICIHCDKPIPKDTPVINVFYNDSGYYQSRYVHIKCFPKMIQRKINQLQGWIKRVKKYKGGK